ncbi:MAG: DNA-formamidopyrimidine glycosylase family protein [Desulfuromonadales bacterium]
MPELPDVEIFREYFQSTALNQEIGEVKITAPQMLGGIGADRLKDALKGRTFESAVRHGKYLFAETQGGWLVLHFGMTGFLRYEKSSEPAPEHARLMVKFANGYRLAFDCARKLGRIGWTKEIPRFVEEQDLGVDPLDESFDRKEFRKLLEKRRGSIKGLLMNQKALAGVGNIYSDEILFHAGISPRRSVKDLRQDECDALYGTMEEVLHTAIEWRVGEKGWPENWLLPRRRPDEDCPRCGGKIEKVNASGRSAYYCPAHQD